MPYSVCFGDGGIARGIFPACWSTEAYYEYHQQLPRFDATSLFDQFVSTRNRKFTATPTTFCLLSVWVQMFTATTPPYVDGEHILQVVHKTFRKAPAILEITHQTECSFVIQISSSRYWAHRLQHPHSLSFTHLLEYISQLVHSNTGRYPALPSYVHHKTGNDEKPDGSNKPLSNEVYTPSAMLISFRRRNPFHLWYSKNKGISSSPILPDPTRSTP